MQILNKLSQKLFPSSKQDQDQKEQQKDSQYSEPSPTQIPSSASSKLNVHEIYNQSKDYTLAPSSTLTSTKFQENHLLNFENTLGEINIDLQKLKEISWYGVPRSNQAIKSTNIRFLFFFCQNASTNFFNSVINFNTLLDIRFDVWRLLLDYSPTNQTLVESTLSRQRQEYSVFIQRNFKANVEQSQGFNSKMYQTIQTDVPRTQPNYAIFYDQRIQNMLRRVLYLVSYRKPACGYVQGMNEIATPFIIVFLSQYIYIDFEKFDTPNTIDNITEETLFQVEADTYWCMSSVLDKILDNYNQNQLGIKKCLEKICQLIEKIDPQLSNHLKEQKVDFVTFAYRWVLCLFIREFSLQLIIRMFDTYLADDRGFETLHCYAIVATILKFSKQLKLLSFNEIVILMQNIPTEGWTEDDMNTILAESYVFMSMYENTQGHIKSGNSDVWH